MNAHDQLERQLRATVARNAPAAGHPPGRRRQWMPRLPELASGLVVVASLAIAVVVLLAVRHGSGPVTSVGAAGTRSTQPTIISRSPKDPGPIPANVDASAVSTGWNTAWAKDPICRPGTRRGTSVQFTLRAPKAAMLSALPELSTPVSKAARQAALNVINARPPAFQGGAIFLRFVRRARAAEGRVFYLVPVSGLGKAPLSASQANRCHRLTVAALAAELPKLPVAERAATRRYGDAEYALGRYNLEHSTVYDGVNLFESDRGGASGSTGGESLAMIERGGELGGGGGGKPFIPIVMDGIVPAGVTLVTLEFPATRYQGRSLPALRVTGKVVNDIFVVAVPTLFERGGWPAEAVWRSASGHVIKTINERPFHP